MKYGYIYNKAHKFNELSNKYSTFEKVSYTIITHSSSPTNNGTKQFINNFKYKYWRKRSLLKGSISGAIRKGGTLWYEVIDNKTNELVEIIK